jgi:transcriptional regulator GlxA family with amidase domain
MADLASSIKTKRPEKRDSAAGLCSKESQKAGLEKAVAEYEDGMNVTKLADRFKVSRRTLARYTSNGASFSSGAHGKPDV